MRLLSLHEPWATLMMLKFKRVETRDWAPAYRGPLAIHASKHGMSLFDTLTTCLSPVFFNALMAYEPFRNAVMPYYRDGDERGHRDIPKAAMKEAFPNRGKILCVVDLKDVVSTSTVCRRYQDMMTSTELAFGNYDAVDTESLNARQAWITEFIFRLPEPIPFTSKQGLVVVPMDVHQEMQRQWNLTQK